MLVSTISIPTVALGRSASVQDADAQAAPAAQITIEAGNYFFRAPRRAPAGWTTIRLRNGGPSFHHVVLLRLKPGESSDSVLARVLRRRGDPDVAIPGSVSVGGPEGHMPSGDSYATVNLLAGEYLIVCTIPSDDGSSHASRGMSALLTVVPRTPAQLAPAPPVPDLVVRMADYAYSLSREQLSTGWRTFRIENAGKSEHIAELARLKVGRSPADMFKWAAADFAASAEPKVTIGGSTRVVVGGVSFVHARLTPGRYVIFCMLHDRSDRHHIKLGMLKEFTVE